MPVRINNLESNVTVVDSAPSGGISEREMERIVRTVLDRVREEQERIRRIGEETRITNTVSKQDIFN